MMGGGPCFVKKKKHQITSAFSAMKGEIFVENVQQSRK